jgi:hypothetical protein
MRDRDNQVGSRRAAAGIMQQASLRLVAMTCFEAPDMIEWE